MREIKFRVWHKKKKVMFYPYGIHWAVNGKYRPKLVVMRWTRKKEFELLGLREYMRIKDLLLMQYTGFADAGAEEFYDGDILEDDAEWYKIEWWQSDGQWMCVPIRHNPLQRDNIALCELAGSSTCWKQGNIYENTELYDPQNH